MRFTQEFDEYLNQFRLRLKQLVLARGTAMISVAALVVTVVAVAAAVRNGFPDDIVDFPPRQDYETPRQHANDGDKNQP